MASGYEKGTCGVDPNRGWDVLPRRPRLQALIDRALFVGSGFLFGAMIWGGWKFFFG